MENQSAKKARMAPAKSSFMGTVKKLPAKGGPVNEPREEEEEEESAGAYTVEAAALRCDICYKPFGDQIFMCKNGHPACGSCCLTMKRKCSCCTEPIGDIRCRPLEKALAAMTRPCTYVTYGCHQTVSYTERRRHEEACRYAPYHCPFEDCTYYGLLLYNHIQDHHASDDDNEAAVVVRRNRRSTVTLQKTMPFRVLLHRDGASMFLLLNGGDVLAGRSLSLVCMGPRPTGNAKVKNKMEVKKRRDPGALVLWSSGAAPFVRRLKDFRARGFLFVPNAYWDSSDSVSVTVHLTDGW